MSWDVCQPWGLRYWVHPSTFQPVIICEQRQMKKLNWILSKNRILVSVWKFYHLSNDCHIAFSALFCSPSNRKPSFFSSICDPCAWVINWWEKNSVCNLQYRPKTLLVRFMSRQHGWKLPSNSWTLSSYNIVYNNCLSDIYLFVIVIYALRHSLIQSNFCSVAENISGPVMLEQYVAIADYKKQNRNEVSMVAGDIVEVIDKNENGKFCILYFLPCPVFEICYIL